ncbi:MAG: dockerin type I repeat-containing protein [Clostridia bacterium]|nr:dockerin type I repeat-containing protein [Clostridia bacterium]
MKKALAIILAALLAFAALPVMAKTAPEMRARTELLDLTAQTSPVSNAAEGWAFDPAGNGGAPLLTLESYGSASAHAAPILLPANSTVRVNGECYIDNAVIGEDRDVLSGSCDGYFRIEGEGTLNLYARQHKGRCVSLPLGGENVNEEFLYIHDVTLNCYGMERTNNNSSTLPPCIYGAHAIEIKNAVVNTDQGSCGINMQGFTPIGGVNEENTNELLVENSTVNIQNESANNLWNYAKGMNVTFGRVRFVNSDVTINAGSNSIYAYLSLVIESGSVYIRSTPASTAASAALVYCNYLAIGDGVESLYFTTTKFPLTKVINCKTSGASTLASNLLVEIGSFEGGNFATAPDSENNDLPALKISGGEPVEAYTVNFYGLDGVLLSSVSVPYGEGATAPEAPQVVNNENGTYIFCGWDAEFDSVTENMNVYAEYTLLGDADQSEAVNVSDALEAMRHSMGLISLEGKGFTSADVDFDGSVTVSDALTIMRFSMGIINSLI